MRFFGDPELARGEEVAWQRNANREQGLRQVGGRLFLTDRRLLFLPNRFDAATGGRSWTCALREIAAVTVEPSRLALPVPGQAARLRRRLRVEQADGLAELFVVNRVDAAASRLQTAVAPTRTNGG